MDKLLNPLPHYFALLRDAFDAHEARDLHDLDSNDPLSVEAHAALKQQEIAAQGALIEYIAAAPDYLRGALSVLTVPAP